MASKQAAPAQQQSKEENEEDKYDVLEKIGQGSFGVIRKVRRKEDGQILARKEISYARMSQREREQLHAELSILQRLSQHPNIVSYLSRCHEKSSHELHLYMEYCGNGDLGGYIRRLKETESWASEQFVWDVAAGVVSALWRCHYGEDPPKPGEEASARPGKSDGLVSKKGHQVILHRDLKPENVFLGANNTTKLGDFGLSKIIASHDFASTYVGTPFYMSPEICAAERYSTYSDIWSLGCILYELCAREPPFNARSHPELIMKIRTGRFKPLHGAGGVDGGSRYSKELDQVVGWCLRVNPRERPDAAQLLNVPKVREARVRQDAALQSQRVEKERDVALIKLGTAQKEIEALRSQIVKLENRGKELKMEYHTRAALAIDQKVSETVERQRKELLAQFEQAVDVRAEEKLSQHLASLPSSHYSGSEHGSSAVHIRSATPPGNRLAALPGPEMMSFTTTEGTVATRPSSASGVDNSLGTDMTSLSINDVSQPPPSTDHEDTEEDVESSPLAQRHKPFPPLKKQTRTPFSRAKTLASFAPTASPMDVQMADQSPLAPMSIKGLSLSPRRQGHDRESSGLSGRPLRRNVFDTVAYLPPPSEHAEANASGGFCDDFDDEDVDADSPSRPTSGLSNHTVDPFKALASDKGRLGAAAGPQKRQRPSLGRAQTMAVQPSAPLGSRQPRSTNIFAQQAAKVANVSDENRRPTSRAGGSSNVPVPSAGAVSPSRRAARDNSAKALTPSRKAPPPPSAVAKSNSSNQRQTAPGGGNAAFRGRTLIELSQGRAGGNGASESDGEVGKGIFGGEKPILLPSSPAKWCPEKDGEEMPSPFLAKKGRMLVGGVR